MCAKDVDESAPKYYLTLRKLLTNIFLRNFRVFLFLKTWTQLSTTGLHQPVLLLSYSPGSNYPTPVTGNLLPENDIELGPIFHIFFPIFNFLIYSLSSLKAERQIWDILQGVSYIAVKFTRKLFILIWQVVFKLGYAFCQKR